MGVAPPTRQVMDRWASFLEAWAASQNHPLKIIGRLVATNPNEYVVQFRPDAPLPAVARVEFTGNQAIDTTTLQNSIGSVAYGLPYTEASFRELLNNQLRGLYEAKGYLEVRFSDITSEPVPDPVKGVTVHVKITEGAPYKLKRVLVSGIAKEDREEIEKHIDLKKDEPVNMTLVAETVEKTKKQIQRAGYYRATAESERHLDEKAKTIEILIKVDRGERYHFNSLTIKGLDIEGENAVRKMWAEKPDDPFNADYPAYFLKEVQSAGLFDYLGPTRSEVKIDDQAHLADVMLYFDPAPKKEKKDALKRPE
jgi:outer membrane protein insertion porin family